MKTGKVIYILLLGSLVVTSCIDDFLNLKPLDSETEAIFFQNLEQFQAAAEIFILIFTHGSPMERKVVQITLMPFVLIMGQI